VARRPAPLPTDAEIARWRGALRGSPASAYLTGQRGLSANTINRYELGWNGNQITLPIRDAEGLIVNVRRRALGPGQPFKGLVGRGSQLFPASALAKSGPIAICEGEFDAMLLNQGGFAAVTSTAGAGHWNPEWTPLLSGRVVAVIYDVDAENKAAQRAAEFREAGVLAFVVPLSRIGLSGNDDVSDVVVREGWTVADLKRYVAKCWRQARRAA
jgi:DNA primase